MLDKIQLQLDREEEKKEKMASWVGRGNIIIRGRPLFQIFPSKGGDYLREAINLSSDSYYSRKYSKHLF